MSLPAADEVSPMAVESAGADRSEDRREQAVLDVLLHLAGSLVQRFDADDLLHELVVACIENFDADAGGVMLADRTGTLRAVAATTRDMEQLEILEIATGEGPSREAYRRREDVVERDLRSAHDRWPILAARARQLGFVAGYGFPLRLRERTIGALNLFQVEARQPLLARDLRAARAFADIATITLISDELHQRAGLHVAQLEHALHSRVVLEQAKGVLAERLSITPSDAFDRLRRHARHHNRRIHAVAEEVVAGRLTP